MEFDEKRAKVEKQVIEHLTKRMFKEAILTVAAYEAEQTHPRGIGIDWKHYNPNHDVEMLKTIFESKPPKIIVRLRNEKLEALRVAAAMMTLWGKNKAKKWLPADFKTDLSFDVDTIARMRNFHATHRATLERYRSEKLKYVEILPAPDSCEACRKLAGKRYEVNEAPELPNERCTHKMGCRCVFLPCID